MNFQHRFSRLMAEALHCSSAPEGLALPLQEVHERLCALADEERARPLPSAPDMAPADASPLALSDADDNDPSRTIRLACENARFAVYAWIDEQLLQSPRLDAADWLALSLQYRYFGTTSAGRDFFARLTAIARSAVPIPPGEDDEDELSETSPRALEVFALHSSDALSGAVMRIYALCLLYGFKGMLRDSPEILTRYRKAAHALLQRDTPPPPSRLPQELPAKALVAAMLEKIAYVILPPVIVFLFATLCAASLADIPLPY